MARPKKVTAEVLERVPALIEQGLVAAQIAGAIGCTLGTLRVRCSQAGVSLRRKNDNKPKIAVRNRVGGLSGPISTGDVDEISANGPGAKSTMRSCLPHAARISSGLPNRPAPIALLLQQTTVDQLRQRAARKGVSAATFVSMLLEVIVRDQLYDAVLDGNEEFESGRSEGGRVSRRESHTA